MMELIVGQTYRIKNHKKAPWFWGKDMEEWRGRVVTVIQISKQDQPRDFWEVLIREDDRHWVWGGNDFEEIEQKAWDE